MLNGLQFVMGGWVGLSCFVLSWGELHVLLNYPSVNQCVWNESGSSFEPR